MFDDVKRFIVVDSIFERYIIIVDIDARTTSVYCTECEMWVTKWQSEQVSRHTHAELFELITDTHRPQVVGHSVEIADISKHLSNWRD